MIKRTKMITTIRMVHVADERRGAITELDNFIPRVYSQYVAALSLDNVFADGASIKEFTKI